MLKWKILFLVLFWGDFSLGIRLQFFDEHNFTRLHYDVNEPKANSSSFGCHNLKQYENGKVGSVKTSDCIIAYQNRYCEGLSVRVDPPGNPSLDEDIASFHLCNETIGGVKVHVDLLDSSGGLLMEYADICECEDLPTSVSLQISKLNNYGNCVALYPQMGCGGEKVEIVAGKNSFSEDIKKAVAKPKSLSSCGPRPSCIRLSAQIYKFDVTFKEENILNRIRRVELGEKTRFFNNGSATVTQHYHSEKKLREKFVVDRNLALISMNSFSIQGNTTYLGDSLINSVLYPNSGRVWEALKLAYSIGESQDISKVFEHSDEKLFSVSDEIQVASCYDYDVTSTLTIAENVPLSYKVFAKISGRKSGLEIPVDELQKYVSGMKMIGANGNFLGLFEATQNLEISIGLNTSITGDGAMIEHCTEYHDRPICASKVGGCEARRGEFPYQAIISYDGEAKCGGAIISRDLVLTSASCLQSGKNILGWTVTAGALSLSQTLGTEQIRNVDKIYIHSGFNKTTRLNDVGIMVLSSPLVFNADVGNVGLPLKGEMFDGLAFITGLGREGHSNSSVLKHVSQPIDSIDECVRQDNREVELEDKFCVGEKGKLVCQGDLGGPVICRRKGTHLRVLCGISLEQGCSRPGHPQLYTKVASHADWIEEKVRKAVHEPKLTRCIRHRPRTCEEVQLSGHKTSGIYRLYKGPVPNLDPGMNFYCDLETEGGGWTVFQRRQATLYPNDPEDFQKNWNEYARGFGNLNDSFWFGLNSISELTKDRNMELRVDLLDWDGESRFAEYRYFEVTNSSDLYRLYVDEFLDRGGAGDSLSFHNSMPFTTWDRDNDRMEGGNCATQSLGAWWHKGCHRSNLNGVYSSDMHGRGVNWGSWKGIGYALKKTEMKIRRRDFVHFMRVNLGNIC